MLEERLPKTVKNYKTVEKKEESVARRECLCGRGQRYMGMRREYQQILKDKIKDLNKSKFLISMLQKYSQAEA